MNEPQNDSSGDHEENASKADIEAIDLENERPASDDLERPGRHRERIERMRERTRMGLAASMILPVPTLVILPWVALAAGWGHATDVKDLALALLGPVSGLAGAVLGFYFGRTTGIR